MVEESLSHFSLIAWEGLSTELPKLLSIDNKLQTGSSQIMIDAKMPVSVYLLQLCYI